MPGKRDVSGWGSHKEGVQAGVTVGCWTAQSDGRGRRGGGELGDKDAILPPHPLSSHLHGNQRKGHSSQVPPWALELVELVDRRAPTEHTAHVPPMLIFPEQSQEQIPEYCWV